MRDLTASNEPTFTATASTTPGTEPTCTATPTVDNVCVAPLFTTFLVPGLESPHADILEVSIESLINTNNNCEIIERSVYQLPPMSNRGKPPYGYSPEPATKVKYLISHYMSTHRLSKAYQAFVNQMSTVAISSKVQDALSDSKWASAMSEEIQTLEKNKT